MLETIIRVALIGAGATAVMDLWGLMLKRGLGVKGLDYAMVGRWIGHMPGGRLVHRPIAAAAPVRGERMIGWTAHYAIGVGFAAALVIAAGSAWLAAPTPGAALAFGALSVAAPFLVLQPALGMGLAARRAPKPWTARARSLTTHLVFGAGLYLSALAVAAA